MMSSMGERNCDPSLRKTLQPLSVAGLCDAVIMIPISADFWRTAKERTGVGITFVKMWECIP